MCTYTYRQRKPNSGLRTEPCGTPEYDPQETNRPVRYTGCLKIREFRIQSVVGDHFSSPNMEIKKNGTPPTKIHWSEGALFEVRFLQIQTEKLEFIVIYGVDDCGK
jgi:hypothetical protein